MGRVEYLKGVGNDGSASEGNIQRSWLSTVAAFLVHTMKRTAAPSVRGDPALQ